MKRIDPREELAEILAIEREARRLGISEERARLRPLLERCESAVAWHLSMIEGGTLLADLRSELGKNG